MGLRFIYILMFLPLLTLVSAQTITGLSAFTGWLPILILAILISLFIVSFIYFAGSVLNSSKIKSRAVEELGQVIGTIIIAVIVIAVVEFFGSASVTSIAASAIGRNIQNICNTLENNQLVFVNPNTISPTNTICTETNTVYTHIKNGNANSVDPAIFADYDLMASYIVVANLTSQMAQNLDALYKSENYIGFLASIASNTYFCVSANPAPPLFGAWCIIPIDPRALDIGVSFRPYAGYTMLKSISKPLETQAYLIFEIYLVEMLIILVFLYLWPYLLAAGIILKASLYTRRVGGMLIGIVIGGLIIFPIIFLIEYAALSNATLTPIGANQSSIPVFSINGETLNGKPVVYNSNTINFFVFPNLTNVANYYGCYTNNIFLTELEVSAYFAIPAVGLYLLLVYGAVGAITRSLPNIPLNVVSCQPQNALNFILKLPDIYGIIGVTGYILPIINILVLIAAIKGISQLMGGDTNLLGLGKFV